MRNSNITHILVPVDFSAHSEVTFRYATTLALRLGASIELLHVVENPSPNGLSSLEVPIPTAEVRESVVADRSERLSRYTAPSRLRLQRTLRVGTPVQTILGYAESGAFDLIVMGTHGRTGLAHLLMGSVTEQVIRHAPCPVVTLRDAMVSARTEVAEPLPVAHAALVGETFGSWRTLSHLGSSLE